MPKYYDADEATALLGVSKSTLYAYVSRGKIRSAPSPGSGRARRYVAADVDRLASSTQERRDPDEATRRALDWGRPVLTTHITEIDSGELRYRGVRAERLAVERDFESAAAHLWRTDALTSPTAPNALADQIAPRLDGLPLMKRCQVTLAIAEHLDPRAYLFEPRYVARTGASILGLLAHARDEPLEHTPRIADALAHAWAAPDWAADLIDASLTLCADHGLNASTFAARVAASAGATPYGAAQAGLAAMLGRRHGGITARIGALLDEVARAHSPLEAIIERLRRGAPIPGFGHRLYPKGDPRARYILDRLDLLAADHPACAHSRGLRDAAHELLDDGLPTVDLALVTLTRALGRPDADALYLFTLARSVGWIAHTIEQYADGSLLRPRAEYRRGP